MRGAAQVVAAGGLLACAIGLAVATGGAAFAADSGGGNQESLSAGTALLIFVAAPLALFLVVAALALLGSGRRRERYRPDRDWDRDAVWFAGPDDAESATAVATPASGTGGASGSW